MSRSKPWPKAANEVRADVIMEAGEIRTRLKGARSRLVELQQAIERRDLLLALAITAGIEGVYQVVDKSAEIIVLKLESARADNGLEEVD